MSTSDAPAADGPRRAPSQSVLHRLTQAATAAGIGVVDELYNEALGLADDGHYGEAKARLQVLLGLSPSDGDAHLLLAQIHVAGQQWKPALRALDEAAAHGAAVPEDLRESVVTRLQAESVGLPSGERDTRLAAESEKMRANLRDARAEIAHLEQKNRKLDREGTRFGRLASFAMIFAIVMTLFNIYLLANSGGEEAVPTEELVESGEVQTPPAAPPVEAPPERVAATPPPAAPPAEAGSPEPAPAEPPPADAASQAIAGLHNPSLAATATARLTEAGFGNVRVTVRDDEAELTGSVPTYRASKQAAELVLAVPGIETVTAEALVNTAAARGGTYVVEGGDSWARIATKVWGKEHEYPAIYKANPELHDTTMQPGMKIKIPALPAE